MESLVATFSKKISPYSAEDQERINTGLSWAEQFCAPQQDHRGDSILGVASILVDLNLDADTVIAAVLQNSLENTLPKEGDAPLTREAIAEKFGAPVALMVEGVTRIADISAKNKTNHEAENIRKMLFAMVSDIRVILIKLADKLYNMRTLDLADVADRKAVAQECLDIYAPLADRLGISWMKDELEDLSLKYLNREVFLQIKEIVALKRGERRDFLEKVLETITAEAKTAGIDIAVESRAKHFYSIYQKMRKRNKAVGDLYDLMGIRILCNSIEDCYNLLGLVHRLWKPLDGRFKDYIAMHKANGYQSLHTTVMCAWDPLPQASPGDTFEGRLLEIQIRTWEMHQVAEYGIASHWLYKKGSSAELVRPGDLSIVNRLKDWKQAEGEEGSSESFLEDIKGELLKDSIYVFTPQGKVIELPLGSTPVDFAYHIHSAVGDHCAGAKADGIIIPLSAELQNTQVVEILTATNARPHVNWLRFVKTSKARNRIRSWLQENDDSVIIEKNIIAKKKTPPIEPAKAAPLPEKEKILECPVQRFVQEELGTASIFQVRVEDEKNMMIRFAKCCNPVAGDPILGYVSRGRGIIIHRKNCSNLANIPDFAERRIDTEWENSGPQLKRFKVEARLSTDLFSEIEGAVRKHQGHLIEGRLEETSTNHLTGFFTMQLEQAEDLKKIMKNIRGIPAVYSILSLN
ncbi:RelA/SpoT family protein [Treponema primitia]|uniref:RelA/SpoT family protein n=1 Tax=Treponema primitia TaxID=88058 RepID=UPI00025555D5|nr:RelA/SpoT family protein [Treponema primitia]